MDSFYTGKALLLSFVILTNIGVFGLNIGVNRAFGADLLFSSTVGYNSNPALESKDSQPTLEQLNISDLSPMSTESNTTDNIKSSLFSSHTLLLEDSFTFADKFKVDLSPSVSYQNFWDMADNHRFEFDISILPFGAIKQFNPYLFTKALFYRDSLITADQRDQFSFGAGGEIVLNSRYNLYFEHEWQHISYLEDAPIFFRQQPNLLSNIKSNSNLNQQCSSNMAKGKNSGALNQIYDAKNDINMIFNTRLDIFISPEIQASVGLKYEHLTSSLDAESFWQLTPEIKFSWDFAPKWQFVISAQVERKKYSDIENMVNLECSKVASSVSIRDVNYTNLLNLRVAHYWSENIEIFSNFFIEDGDYPLNKDSYNQKVVECGLSFSF
ncbi:MAG: hypothetical protein HQK64_01125 [Desulfamplus sp.]|nr:hypothetical protein [Desulfamplus sp.]